MSGSIGSYHRGEAHFGFVVNTFVNLYIVYIEIQGE